MKVYCRGECSDMVKGASAAESGKEDISSGWIPGSAVWFAGTGYGSQQAVGLLR